ncbi:MAG TPA: phosphoglycerate kinase [Candidatus Hydrogenedentes bacterium]|nr:phosphoglycerate kinase [Candidatus Hydrogenedentota bacterium]
MKKMNDIDVSGKSVLLRTEFNVAFDDQCNVVDDSRIRAALPTIEALCNKGARVIICSHLGRPWGKWDPAKSLQRLVRPLSALLGKPVAFAGDCIGLERRKKQQTLAPSEVLLLENVRFYQEENDNDPCFAKFLADGVDVYINDAFGTCHRPHASIAGVPRFVKEKAIGLLVEKELDAIHSFLEDTQHPAVAVVGGAKVTGKDGKIHVIRNLLKMMDVICIVGKIAYYFLKAQGVSAGATLTADTRKIDGPDSDLAQSLEECSAILNEAAQKGKHILLPMDSVVAHTDDDKVGIVDHDAGPMTEGMRAMDLGPRTIHMIQEHLAKANSVVWNGPAGFYEDKRFQTGSLAIAKAVEESHARSLVGGGDTLAALKEVGMSSDRIHVCTGGGAMLAMLMGRDLPAIKALEDR